MRLKTTLYVFRPSPNWSPAATGTPSLKWISTIFSLWTGPPFSVGQCGHDLLRRRVDHFAGRRIGELSVEAERHPPRLLAKLHTRRVLRRHRPSRRRCELARLTASTTHTSFSSGVSPIPWLGQPCRFTIPFLKPGTSTRCSFFPVFRSPISKPSSSFTLTKHSVCAPLTVNGRIDAANGPTLSITLCVLVSATNKSGDFSPAR